MRAREDRLPFYPSWCMLLTRRRFLALGTAVLGGAAGLSTLTPGSAAAGAKPEAWNDAAMRALIDRYARAKDDLWRIAHGIRGVGKEFALGTGESAVAYVLSNAAEEVVNGRTTLHFPEAVEPHTNLYLNNLLEAGVPVSYAFQAHGRRYTLEDLVAGAKARFDLAKAHPNDLAWSLVSFTTIAPPIKDRWVNAWGQPVRVADFVERAFQVAEDATRQVRVTWGANQPLPGKSAIHSFTCGGTHLIYSLVVAVRNGYVIDRVEARLRDQLGMLIYRMGADPDLIDRFFRGVPNGSRGYNRWASLDAKWKFVGHALEVYHYALANRLILPTPAEVKTVDAARGVLVQLAREVAQVELDAVRREDEDLFRQFVGDTCHARRGVSLA